ncbi:hypothetical protein [Micropruina sonneratiae]|uniref:hypothetical protein n=1 Tax=Micropruina sonneratiae TaxID=2986940 RepID=UPI0022278932|nr:hypothetical protein [Micropruina sp. KQZ13P-5]MCW3159087.1 hypothetical protein [Micropruina sp. KQZ13P-5]
MADSVEQYLADVPEAGRPWLQEFWAFVERRVPQLSLTMFRGVPMFKFADSYLKGYVMFTATKTHFVAHAIDFDLVAETREAIRGAAGGKGSVSVTYANTDAKPRLQQFVTDVLRRHGYLED